MGHESERAGVVGGSDAICEFAQSGHRREYGRKVVQWPDLDIAGLLSGVTAQYQIFEVLGSRVR